jgi:TrpR-related protein YerC/YecD
MRIETPDKEKLFKAMLSLESQEECNAFMRDLLTQNEIEEFALRFKAACMLSDEIPYTVIQEETGLSSTTVARISKWLNSGMNGYKLIIDRVHHTDS